MDTLALVNRLLQAKEERRHTLARAPFEEKIKMLIKLQEMAAPVLRARGITVRPWRF